MKEDINIIADKEPQDPPENKSLKEEFIVKEGPVYKKTGSCLNIMAKIFPCLKKVDTEAHRMIYFNHPEMNITNWSNKVENNKYTLISFFPVTLFNQFKQFGNFFYLLLSITQFIPQLKVGFAFTYISPLAFVIMVSMVKEAYDDINRRIQDNKTNGTEIDVLVPSEGLNTVQKIKKTAADLLVGDIIELKKDSRVPADMIVLKTFNESNENQAFIRTDQLDGETDWKLRKAPGATQAMSELELFTKCSRIECEPPSKLIYNFLGRLFCENNNEGSRVEPLNLENTMWASTVVASLKVIGIVIYTGKETRAIMNSSVPKVKTGILDKELNFNNVYLFAIMFILSFILAAFNGFNSHFILLLLKFVVLFCAIIPISLRVNLDVSKTYFSFVINRDKTIPETIARNSTIPEELGRISYIFSDKTGTLTKNEMVFKKIAMETEQFGEENFSDLKSILSDECKAGDAPMLDLVIAQEKSNEINTSLNDSLNERQRTASIGSVGGNEKKKGKKIRRQRNKIVRDTITSMVLCNNVTPIFDDNDMTKVEYQASSPDEVALVKFAETIDMRLIGRTDKEIKIRNSADNIEEYEILANFPFSSDTKRMGIVLKNKKHGHIIFYLKGAESIMMKFVKKEYISYISENAENLATKGLRTLVLTQKLITQEEFDEWNKEYKEALTSMENRQEKISNVVSKLENNMEFLCVTGVEDLLQNDVATTIDNLRNAGMKVWMLTGDKVETATCISISAGIKGKQHKIYTIKYDQFTHESVESDTLQLKKYLKEYEQKIEPSIFIIDGDTLDLALKNCEQEFFHSSMQAPSVVCCRCSPTQKRIIVKTIKKYTSERTAAVGDGGNDVAMIQEADIGIGIVGKEGLQASLAADYSIKEFKTLSVLLLWWGRIAYKNTSTMANFIIHRGMIISLNQFIFSAIFHFIPLGIYNGFLLFGYSTIFTSLPSISVLLDKDIVKENVLKFPTLYKILLKGRELNLKNFLFWSFKSIFQSAILMFFSILWFSDNIFLTICTVTFTELIFLEVLNVYLEINKYHWFMFVSFGVTLVVYILTITLLREFLDVSFIFEGFTFFKILAITAAAWCPFFVVTRIKKKCIPETIDKLNQAGNMQRELSLTKEDNNPLGL